MHDNPPGLRATLVDNTFVIVESPPHPNDKRGQPIHARIPINGGLISFIEDLIPVRHALDHDESLGLGRLAVEQSNKLGPQVGVTKEEAVKEAAKAESVPAPEAKRRGRPPKASPKVAEAIKRLHEDPPPDPTEEDKALLEDDEWDEKMEKAEAAREERLARLRGEVA